MVPPSHMEMLYAKAAARNRQCLFVEFPSGMHMDTWLAGGDRYWRTIQQFLQQTAAGKKDYESKQFLQHTAAEKKDSESMKEEESSVEGDGKSKILDLPTHIYIAASLYLQFPS